MFLNKNKMINILKEYLKNNKNLAYLIEEKIVFAPAETYYKLINIEENSVLYEYTKYTTKCKNKHKIVCPVCDGTGKVDKEVLYGSGKFFETKYITVDCNACNGTGKVCKNFEKIKTIEESGLEKILLGIINGNYSLKSKNFYYLYYTSKIKENEVRLLNFVVSNSDKKLKLRLLDEPGYGAEILLKKFDIEYEIVENLI